MAVIPDSPVHGSEARSLADHRSPDGGGFGDTLRQLRIRAQLTQETLAERAGLSARTISGMETGKIVQPRTSSILCLADALGLVGADRSHFATLARNTYWASRMVAVGIAGELGLAR